MSKQINFYSTNDDKVLIAEILKSIFGELINVPYYEGDFSVFDESSNEEKLYLTESNLQQYISYRIHEYSDGTITKILDYTKSPVLEYSTPFQREDKVYVNGRFYYCSDDIEFSKKISKFFNKLKREFWYVKKWKCYVSKNINIETSSFFIPNRIVTINKEDLK